MNDCYLLATCTMLYDDVEARERKLLEAEALTTEVVELFDSGRVTPPGSFVSDYPQVEAMRHFIIDNSDN